MSIRRSRWSLVLLLWGCLPGAFAASVELDWPWLKYTPVALNHDPVTHIGHVGDARLFIGGKSGLIRILEGNTYRPTPFLDLTARIRATGEGGLWSVAFSPRFAQSGQFYVAYSRKPDGATVVSRFAVSVSDGNVANAASEQIILINPHPAEYHYGGQLAFGPDGFLYVSCGDALNSANAQRLDTFHGKILRIDPEGAPESYRIPASNPFLGQNGALAEIWALGLRNPWRFSFDRLTGDLYLGDVGESTREEIDFQPASSNGGENYGWPYWEGAYRANASPPASPSTQFMAPAVDYLRGDSFAIIGGVVYRGPDQPRMNGVYFHGDVSLSKLWGMKHNGVTWQTEAVAPKPPAGGFITFGEDKDGRIYVAAWDQIYRLEDSGAAAPPRFDPSGSDVPYWLSDRVRVISRTVGAVIHFTTDGREPTEADPVVAENGTVSVTNGTLLSARAWRDDLTPSEITRGRISLMVAPPTFTPRPGVITNGTSVAIACATPDAEVHYTLDGSEPGLSSPLYTGPLRLDDIVKLRTGLLLRAIAYRSGFEPGRHDGYYLLPQVASPGFNPPGGLLRAGTPITLTCFTPGAVIHYQTNGEVPTATSPLYLGPIFLGGSGFVRAMATREDMRDSDVTTYHFNFVPAITSNVLGSVLQFSATNYNVAETRRVAYLLINRTDGFATNVSVHLLATNGSALAGQDFTAIDTNLTFLVGEKKKLVAIPLQDDQMEESSETIVASLDTPTSGAVLGARTNATITLRNNDTAGVIQLGLPAYRVSETNGSINVLIRRSGGAASNVTVRLQSFDWTAGADDDFARVDTVVTFGTGERSKAIPIAIFDDNAIEPTEVARLKLSDVTGGARLGVITNATLFITDNEISALGTYVVSGAAKTSGCTNGAANGSVGLQGLIRIDSQVGSNFTGTAMLILTTGSGYGSLTMTGSVNSARQFMASYQADAGGPTSTGALTGSIRGEKLQLSLDGFVLEENCRQRGILAGASYTPLPERLAPVCLASQNLSCTVAKATGFFAGLQPYHIEFSTADACQVVSATSQFPSIDGRYVYIQTGRNTATVRIGSNQERNLLFQLTFTSATNGIFTGTAAGVSGSQAGTFTLSN